MHIQHNNLLGAVQHPIDDDDGEQYIGDDNEQQLLLNDNNDSIDVGGDIDTTQSTLASTGNASITNKDYRPK